MKKQALDFMVIGAQKSGTTSLFQYMRGHPELHLPDAKEIPYFSHRKHRLTWAEYLEEWFDGADPERRWGTVTPQYMVGGLYQPVLDTDRKWGDPRTVPARIREQVPDVRLIAILRDPVERARSHYDWAIQTRRATQPFGESIHDLLRADALEAARDRPAESTGYITWGEYGRILTGYFDEFPRENILVVYTSDLKRSPEAVMHEVFGFLGVNANYVPPNLGSIYSPSASVPRHIPALRLDRLQARAVARPGVMRVWHVIPESARKQADRQFQRLDYWVDTKNRLYPRTEFAHVQESRSESRGSAPQLEQTLRDYYEADGRLLASLLGAAPPWLEATPEMSAAEVTGDRPALGSFPLE